MKLSEIPVYFFAGFLESGKTTFIKDTLNDPEFNEGERMLLILCEEGEEEFDESAVCMENVVIHRVESEDDLNSDLLEELQMRYDIECVLVEYNGMWNLSSFYNALPENWLLYQRLTFIDTKSFEQYNKMFRNLMVDKINGTELVVFNRCGSDVDRMELHKQIRAISRKIQIAYENNAGKTEYDEIEDPLPFDVEASVIEVNFEDYALFYRDIVEETAKYNGKVVVVEGNGLPNGKASDCFGFGRKVMTCCVEDIQFAGFIAENKTDTLIDLPGWFRIMAKISVRKHKAYKRPGPVLEIMKIEPIEAPSAENEVATFY